MSRGGHLLDVAAQFGSSILGRGCYLGLQVFLARRLGPERFGLYAIAWTVVGLVGTLAPIGMPQAVLRFDVAGRRVLSSTPLLVACALGTACTVLVWTTADVVARRIFADAGAAPVIAAFAPSIVLLAAFQVLTAAMRGSQAVVASAIVSAAMFAIYLAACAAAFLVFDQTSAVTAGWMYALALAVACVPAALLLHRRPSSSKVPRLPELTRFGLITVLIHSASVLNLWADRLIVGVMADAEAVGVYQVASQLAMVALVLRVAVISVFEARVPKQRHDGAPPDVTQQFVAATRILLHVTAPGLVCLTATAAFWTQTLFGRDYGAAAIPLAVLVVGQLVQSFAGPSVTALHMTGGERYAAGLTIATGLLNIAANVALIPVLGLAGSAAASGLANVALAVGGILRLSATGRLRLRARHLGDTLLAAIVCAALSLGWSMIFSMDRLIPVVALLLLDYLVYAAVVARFCRVEDEVLGLLRRFAAPWLGSRLPETPASG